MQSRTRTKFNI